MNQYSNNINFLEEIEPYMNRFERAKVIDGKLISCSPFRYEQHPSFVLFLDKGNWVDSGTHSKGSFIELLSFLTGDDPEGVAEALKLKYNALINTDELTLDLQLNLQKKGEILPQKGISKEYLFRHPYLGKRGISEQVQRAFKVGFDKQTNAVVIPWANKKGGIIRLMFRSVNSKKFWYSAEGDRIKSHLFGLQFIHRKQSTTAWVVEAPIDCLYLWTNGIPSVATGTASISKQQLKLLKNSPIENLVIASDNDEAGQEFKNQLINELGGALTLKSLVFPSFAKDVNDLTPEQLKKARIQEVKFFKNWANFPFLI